MEQPLIDKEYLQKIVNVSMGRSSVEVEKIIVEAQHFYLKPLLGNELYYNIMRDVSNYADLLGACRFTCRGKTYGHEGIYKVVAYFAYALYLLKSNTTDTSFGLVTKITPNSEPISYQEKKDWHYKYLQYANDLYKDVEIYLEHINLKPSKAKRIKINVIK